MIGPKLNHARNTLQPQCDWQSVSVTAGRSLDLRGLVAATWPHTVNFAAHPNEEVPCTPTRIPYSMAVFEIDNDDSATLGRGSCEPIHA